MLGGGLWVSWSIGRVPGGPVVYYYTYTLGGGSVVAAQPSGKGLDQVARVNPASSQVLGLIFG